MQFITRESGFYSMDKRINHLPEWDQKIVQEMLREANEKGYQRALRDVDYLKPRLAISKARESLKNISHMVADTYNNLGE